MRSCLCSGFLSYMFLQLEWQTESGTLSFWLIQSGFIVSTEQALIWTKPVAPTWILASCGSLIRKFIGAHGYWQ